MEEILELKKVKVYVSTRENHETKEMFNVYKALTKQGKIDLKFRKEVPAEKLPKHTCYLFAKETDISVNQKFEYPVMWISDVDHLEEIEFNQNIKDYLD